MRCAVVAVGSLVLLGGCSSGSEPGLEPVSAPTSSAIELVATEFDFSPAEVAVAAGRVDITIVNDGSIFHDFRIDGRRDVFIEIDRDETANSVLELKPGRYQFYCSIPGHRSSGMEGTLEVRDE